MMHWYIYENAVSDMKENHEALIAVFHHIIRVLTDFLISMQQEKKGMWM